MEQPKIVELAYTINGLHENRDAQKLIDFFKSAGVDWDPRGDSNAWCGVVIRCLCILSGFKDPGPECHQARNYEFYGEPIDVPVPGCIVYGERHAALMVDPDWDFGGKIIGGNQGDMMKEGGLDWYFSDITFAKFVMPVELEVTIPADALPTELESFESIALLQELLRREQA